jgi:hypothetical protein
MYAWWIDHDLLSEVEETRRVRMTGLMSNMAMLMPWIPCYQEVLIKSLSLFLPIQCCLLCQRNVSSPLGLCGGNSTVQRRREGGRGGGRREGGKVTPPLGARAPVLTVSTLPPLSVWPCGPPGRVGKHKGAQTAIGPSQSPSRSLETARPVGRASALDLCPGARFRDPKRGRERERAFIDNQEVIEGR